MVSNIARGRSLCRQSFSLLRKATLEILVSRFPISAQSFLMHAAGCQLFE